MESALSYNNINKYIRLFLIYKIYTNIQQITNIRSHSELRTSRRQRSCNFASKEAIRILIDKQSLSTNKVLYTCKNCITKRDSEEEIRKHVKVCNITPYKSDISMLEEAEKIDRCFIEIDGFKTVGRVNSP